MVESLMNNHHYSNYLLYIYKDIVHRDLKLENILMKEFDLKSDYFFIKVRKLSLKIDESDVFLFFNIVI
jgi:serine/threonine protein kinase